MFTLDSASQEPEPAKVDLKTILVWGGTGGFGRVQGGRWVVTSAANRLIGEVVQSRRRPLLGRSPG